MSDFIADIAVNVPLKQLFSYRISETLIDSLQVGMRVKIPFGRRTTIGFILCIRKGQSDNLKVVNELLDEDNGPFELLSDLKERYPSVEFSSSYTSSSSSYSSEVCK